MNQNKLLEQLERVRSRNNFDPKRYVGEKVKRLNEYFKKYDITDVVLGLSGGIDSSVVYKLLKRTTAIVNGIFIYMSSPGVCNQTEAYRHLMALTTNFHFMDATKLSYVAAEQLDAEDSTDPKQRWVRSQVDPIVRTLLLYSYTTSLNSKGLSTLVAGTTNRDEKYLGFYGKASDGMVDIQPITDINKYEVGLVAEYLGVPESIINRAATGDYLDGQTDEEVFGFPYWFLELQDIHHPWYDKVLELKNKNKHKGEVGSPAKHFDLLELLNR